MQPNKITKLTKDETIHLSHEVEIISHLNHFVFLEFIGYSPVNFKQQPKPVVVTELPKQSLFQVLEQKRNGVNVPQWNDTKKLICIYGIASGMEYLHSLNILHRNISPKSVFFDDNFLQKIGNFGLLRKIHSQRSTTFQTSAGIKGNYCYSSPELLQSNEYSKQNDVYAFALIVYEIMMLEKSLIKDRLSKKLKAI